MAWNHTGQCKRTGGCYNELVVAFFSTGGGVKCKKIYTCWLYHLFINLHLLYLWWHLAHRPPVTLQFMALPSNWRYNSWFGLQIQQSSGVLPWQVLFFLCNCLNWVKSSYLSAAVVIFPWNNTQLTITTLFFFLGKLANVLLKNFYYNALGAFLTHWYNALMVAQNSRGCWCRLTTSFVVHINVAKIAISTSTWYFDTV